MNIADLLGKLAGLVALTALIPYIRSILQGKTKPNRASWFIWASVSIGLLASYHYSGATTTIWLTISYTIIPLSIFLLSLKYGVGGYTALDVICISGAVLGLILWRLTHSPEVALYLNVLVDGLGFIPTLKKAYLNPESEDRLAWSIATVANILNVSALTTWRLKIALFPIYNFAFNAAVITLLLRASRKKKTKIIA